MLINKMTFFIVIHVSPNSLCSTQRYDIGDIVVSSHRTDWGMKSFDVAGPTSWNFLPVDLRSSSFSLDTFTKQLNQHLLGLSYS